MLDKENFEFIREIEDNYKKATMLANLFFKDKKDKGGFPYLGHLQYVSNSFEDEEHKIVGMLHDIIEDTVVSKTILYELGFSDKVIEAIDVLTKNDEDYMSYINKICNSNNALAIDIKLKDLEHNMDIARIINPTDEDYQRIEKYKKCYKILEEKRKKLC
ncbi:MAG: GTP pyrophosphokinase [bacterium]|nr:GTP pyrophosphokinase [bacterium]